jgi:DNA-binding transcriptional LysR family regulator
MTLRYIEGIAMIDLRQFRQFIAVAETLSFRRAAERLHMAQPPLSAAIRKLEEELGVALFDRHNRGSTLTPAGDAFLLEARRAIEQAERAVAVARRAGAGLGGTLRLRFVDSTVNALLPLILRAFQERHPDVGFQLEEGTTAEQIVALRQDRTDVGLVVLPVADAGDVHVEPLLRDRMVAALPDGHRLARRAASRWPSWPTIRGYCSPRITGRACTRGSSRRVRRPDSPRASSSSRARCRRRPGSSRAASASR